MLMHMPLPCTKPPDDGGGDESGAPAAGVVPAGGFIDAIEGPIGAGGEIIMDGPGLMLVVGGAAGGDAMGADGVMGGGAVVIGGAAIGVTVMGGGAIAVGGAAFGATGVIFGGEVATDGGIVTPPPGGEAMGD